MLRAIYLETSALWGIAHRDDDPTLQTVGRRARGLGIAMLTTRLVVDELSEKYVRELRELQGTVEARCRDFGRRGIPSPTVIHTRPLAEVLEELPARIEANLHGYGIEVLENHPVGEDRLLRMAVKKELPFTEKGEKGLRDTVILITALTHARAQGWDQILVVTNDGPIMEALKTLPETTGLTIGTASSVQEAMKAVDALVEDVMTALDNRRKSRCHGVILEHSASLTEFVRGQEYPASAFYGLLGAGESLDEIHEIRVGEIEVAALGDLPSGVTDDRIRVLLTVQGEVDILVSPFTFPTKRYKVGETVEAEPISNILLSGLTRSQYQKTLRVTIALDGSVRAIGEWPSEQFSNPTWEAASIRSGNPIFEALMNLQSTPQTPPVPPE